MVDMKNGGSGRFDICLDIQSRFFVQYKCEQSTVHVAQKMTNSLNVAILEVVGFLLLLFCLMFNY
jgi:hypothetical protein